MISQRRALENGEPIASAMDTNLMKNTVKHYKDKHENRKAIRRKKLDAHDKCVKRRNAYQTDVEERREKRDNVVYYDGTNYTVRWTCMPRYLSLD